MNKRLSILFIITLFSFAVSGQTFLDDLKKGKAAAEAKDYENAIKWLSAGIDKEPKCVECYALRAEQYYLQKNFKDEEVDLIKAITLKPKAELLYKLGNCLFAQKRYEEALPNYNLAIDINPLYEEAYVNRGTCYITLDKFEFGLKDLQHAADLDPNDKDIYFNMAEARFEQKDFDGAIEDLNKDLDIDPMDPEAYDMKGEAYTQLRDFDKAIKEFTAAINLDPTNAEYYMNRGDCYAVMGDFQIALKDLDKAIELNPKYSEAYFSRAFVQKELGHNHHASEDMKQSVRLNTEAEDGRLIAGIDLYFTHHHQRACDMWRSIRNTEPAYSQAETLLFMLCK